MTLPYSEVDDLDLLRLEIQRRDRKIAKLRRDLRSVQAAITDENHRALRNEAQRLRKALSFIWKFPNGMNGDEGKNPESVAAKALGLKVAG